MLNELIDEKVVIDLRSEYVCLGTLTRIDEHYLELKNADLHDLRDTQTTRENYIAASLATGIKRNRKRVLLNRAELVAVARPKYARYPGPQSMRCSNTPSRTPLALDRLPCSSRANATATFAAASASRRVNQSSNGLPPSLAT